MIRTGIDLLSIMLIVVLSVILSVNIAHGVVNPVFDFHFGSFGTGNGQFKVPEDVAIDSSGNIYVADTNNHRIQKFDSDGTYLSKFGATGTGNGQLRAPSAIALDSSGNIYVVDTNNNRIQKFNSAGTYLSQFGATGTGDGKFRVPNDIALDSSGNIYVVDTNNNRIQKFNSAGTYLSKFGSLGSGNGQFNTPSAIAIDSANNIYVADTNNNRIQKFNSAGTYLSKFGSSGSGNGQFGINLGVFVDAYNNIIVSDTGNHRIQKFNSSGNFVLSFGTFGTGENQLNYPQKLTMNGLVGFIADTQNSRIYSFYFPEPPVADDQRLFTLEETPISITLTASDANNDPLTYSIVSSTTKGTLSGVAPLLTYTPNVNSFGTDSFTFKANDGADDSNVSTIEIDVGNINDPPTSNTQAVTTNEDVSLAISATATDADNDSLEFIMVNNVQYGVISGTLPNVTYTPNLNYFGSDGFSFKVNDGISDSNTVTISITINSVNDPPIAYNVNATLNEDTTIYTSSIPYQQTDVENDPVSFIIISMLSNGTLSGDPNNLLYTPNSNYYGTDCLTFKFNDGEFDSNVATACAIILPVNDAPVADEQSVQTDEDTPLPITLTGSDVENDTLSYEIISQPSYGVLSGTAPSITYTPDADAYGTDNFTFRVYDGSEYSAYKTISITINPVNDTPIAYSMNFTTAEDTPFVNAIAVASDIEDDTLSYIVTNPPTHGSLSGVMPFLTYTPDLDYVGWDSFAFKANDGYLDSNVSTTYIEVGPIEDQTITYPQSITTNEDVSVDIILESFDADGDLPTYAIVTQPSSGSLTGVLPNATYVPDQNYFGSDSFSFKANDGLADSNTSTISITVNSINDAPVIQNVNVVTQEDTPYHGLNEYLRISSDAEDDPLTFVLLSPPSHGVLSGTIGNLTYTPNLNYFGSDCVMFKANDGQLDSNVATTCITIQSVNDAPVVDDQQIIVTLNNLQSITLTGSDIENDTLSYQIVSQPEYGMLFGDAPDISYLPNRNYVGVDEFTFKADDGNATSTSATISFTITSVPEQVTGLITIVLSTSQIELSWQIPSEGNSAIIGYKIERESPVGNGWSTIVSNTGSTSTTYSNVGLADNTQYNYRVSAINAIGTSAASIAVSETTLSVLTTPTEPRNLSAIAGDRFVTLNWDESSSDGGEPIFDYVIKYSNDNGATWQIYDDGIDTSTSTTVSGLENNQNYLFQVLAVNSIGQGLQSQVSTMPVSVITSKKDNDVKKQRPPLEISGIGLYSIPTSESKDSYSNLIQGTSNKQQSRFENLFPYSTSSDYTDDKNYGESFGYNKFGGFLPFSKRSDSILFPAKINEPLQIQVRLEDEFASTKIEHLSLFIVGDGQDVKSYSAELIFDKGHTIQVIDRQKFIKDVKVNDFLENGIYWVNFDLVFQKEVKLSDILLQSWDERRKPVYALFVNSLLVTENTESFVPKDAILLTAKIKITHNASSPICKTDGTCFAPNNATILQGGIVTWDNLDSNIHDVTSGTPGNSDNRFYIHMMPGESKQKSFKIPGIYKYFCSLHPWSAGYITVVGSQQDIKEYDETKPPLIVTSVTPMGSVMVEQNQNVIKEINDMRVEISGNIQEGKSKLVTIIVIHPDGTSDNLRASTNDKGYYFVPANLNEKWLEGNYIIIVKYNGINIGQVDFTIKQKKY